MKKKILLLMGVFAFGLLQAQVGINTQTPLAGSVLHIDGDNNPATPQNDVLIDANGNMGIGTVTPSFRLDIEANGATPMIRLVDGTEGVGKILTSDVDGVATWRDGVVTMYQNGTDLINLNPPFTATPSYDNRSITLPVSGWWIVRYNLTWNASHFGTTAPALGDDRGSYVKLFLATTNSGTPVPIAGSTTITIIPYNASFSSVQCSVLFNASAGQTIYLWSNYTGRQLPVLRSYNPGAGQANILDAVKW